MIFPWDLPGGLIGWYAARYGLTREQATFLIRHPDYRHYFEEVMAYAIVAAQVRLFVDDHHIVLACDISRPLMVHPLPPDEAVL